MWRRCWISCAGRSGLFFFFFLFAFAFDSLLFNIHEISCRVTEHWVLKLTNLFTSATFNRQTKGSVACAAYEKMWQTHHHTEAERVNINFHLFIWALFVFFLSAAAITYWFMKVMSLSKHRSRQTWGKIHAQIASLMINRLTCAIHLHVCICMWVYAFPHLRSSDVPWDLIYKTCVCCKKYKSRWLFPHVRKDLKNLLDVIF